MGKNPNVGTGGDDGVVNGEDGVVRRGSVTRAQPAETLSQRGRNFGGGQGDTTAPMNDLPITLVVDTQVGGMHGRAAGEMVIHQRTPEPGGEAEGSAITPSDPSPQAQQRM